jgi:thiol-disulfide isomerase/thioredoxin
MMTEHQELDEPRRSPTPWIAGAVVLVAAGLLAVVVVTQGRGLVDEPPLPRGDEHPGVGKSLEHVDLQPLTGDPPVLAAEDLAGRVTFMNFWGTWCDPCVYEFPHIKELEQHFRDRPDFRFVSVSCTSDGASDRYLADETSDFLQRSQVDFATYHDPDAVTRKGIFHTVGDFAYPTSLVVGRDGKIKAVWIGYSPGLEKQMREIIERELAAETDDPPASEGRHSDDKSEGQPARG